MKRTKNGARQCPYCGLILDPGEICDCGGLAISETKNTCDCGGLPISEIKNTCDWCGSKIIGPEINLSINDEHYKICFRCRLAIHNVRNQRKELRKTQW